MVIGIILDYLYSPSKIAAEFIERTLNKIGYSVIRFSFNDLVNNNITCDTAFNVHYGTLGDSGIIAGLLKSKGIKFIGNTEFSNSIMYNKVVSKEIFRSHNFKTPNYWTGNTIGFSPKEILFFIESVIDYPIISKPIQGAASENITFFNNSTELMSFLSRNKDLVDYGNLFFEEFIIGKEVSAGCVNFIAEELPIIEISLNKIPYQTNIAKFNSGFKTNIIPANLNYDTYKEIQHLAKNLNSIFESDFFSRIDLIYEEKTENLILLEINGNPGLLENSLLPLMIQYIGISIEDFFIALINKSLTNEMVNIEII